VVKQDCSKFLAHLHSLETTAHWMSRGVLACLLQKISGSKMISLYTLLLFRSVKCSNGTFQRRSIFIRSSLTGKHFTFVSWCLYHCKSV
jgi:hypothetical protein